MDSLDRDLTLPELLSEKDREQLAAALAGILGTKTAVVLPDTAQQPETVRIPLLWDLETVGYIEAGDVPRDTVQAAVGVVHMLFKFAARYRMASELHDRMIQADYDELREKHAALQRSEARCKAMAERLEERVAEPNVLKALKRVFFEENYLVDTAAVSGLETMELLATTPYYLIISDHRMPHMNGVELLSRIRNTYPDTIRIMLTGYADTQAVMGAVKDGAVYRFILKPWNDDDLRITVFPALEQYDLIQKNRALEAEKKYSRKNRRRSVNWLLPAVPSWRRCFTGENYLQISNCRNCTGSSSSARPTC